MTEPSDPKLPWPARTAGIILEVVCTASVVGLALTMWIGAGFLDPASLTPFQAALLSTLLFLAVWVFAGLLPPVWMVVLAATALAISAFVWSVAYGVGC